MDSTNAGPAHPGQAPRRRGPARSGLLGAMVGVGAIVGGLVLATGGAGAQPAVADEGEAIELEEHVDEEFERYVGCVDDIFGEAGIDVDADEDAEAPELTDTQWEALEEQLADCDDLLPADWEAYDDEAHEAFDQCLVDNGVVIDHDDHDSYDEDWDEDDWDDEDWDEVIAIVESEDGSTFVEFGEDDGQVSIAKVDGEISVTTEGDVEAETISWDELDDLDDLEELDDWAFEACEIHLPGGDLDDLDQ